VTCDKTFSEIAKYFCHVMYNNVRIIEFYFYKKKEIIIYKNYILHAFEFCLFTLINNWFCIQVFYHLRAF